MDNIIRSIKRLENSSLLQAANQLHANLQFMELETDQQILFLDMLIERRENKLSTAWYSKPTDTAVYLPYNACAPTKYKRNIVEGAVHRIHHTTSSWLAFHSGLETLAKRLEANQYPPNFYGPIIRDTVTKIIGLQPSKTTPQIKSDSFLAKHLYHPIQRPDI